MDWKARIEGIDATKSDAIAQFAALLRQMQKTNGPTYGKINQRAEQNARNHLSATLSKASITNITNGTRLASRDTLKAFLLAMERPGSEIEAWQLKRGEIESLCAPKLLGDAATLRKELETLQTLLKTIHEHNTGLAAEKQRIKQALAESIAERDRLRDELKSAKRETAAERARADQLQAELTMAELLVAERQARLSGVDAAHNFGGQQYEHLLERIGSLELARASIDGFIDNLMSRIGHEQERRQALEEEVAKLVPLLTYYQSAALHEVVEKSPSPPPAPVKDKRAGNQVKTIEWPVRERDLVKGKRLNILVKYAWYCVRCKSGGESRYLQQCPKEGHRIKAQFQVSLTASLPENPHYGMQLCLPDAGSSDNPHMPTSDLLVVLVRPARMTI